MPRCQRCSIDREIARLTGDAALDALRHIAHVPARRVVGTEVILDIDRTVETVHGKLEGSSVAYNPTEHGRASYHPLLFRNAVLAPLDAGVVTA
ncbi:hypothetical protein B1A_13721 [mine drainage metagenome]|uniref:Uncharacterized protein n=1 Tax=mine drainage metagenome TaxID=410659 RepID=T1B531_9ZZZZ